MDSRDCSPAETSADPCGGAQAPSASPNAAGKAAIDEDSDIKQLRETLHTYKMDKSPNSSEDSIDPQEEFQRRPLSDTPVMSKENSPAHNSPAQTPARSNSPSQSDSESESAVSFYSAPETPSHGGMGRISEIPVDEAVAADHANATGHSTTATFTFAGQTRTKDLSECSRASTTEKLVVVMVGLPARGKSYLSKKLVRYLNWLQIPSKIFNVGATRRAKSSEAPASSPLPDQEANAAPAAAAASEDVAITDGKNRGSTQQDASFFSPNNEKSVQMREQWAQETLDSLLDYLENRGGCVGVFDATNTTRLRRENVFNSIKEKTGGRVKTLYLESICNDPKIVDDNIHLKLEGPDYKNMDQEAALEDFRGRLRNYEKVYETITEEEEANKEFQVIQMIDVGRKVIACNIHGFIPSQIIYYFLNFNLSKRLTFVARHGESTDNVKGRIGGDAPLTNRGRKFSKALVRFVQEKRLQFRQRELQEYQEKLNSDYYKNEKRTLEKPEAKQFQVLSSMLKRSVQSAEYFPDDEFEIKELRALNELGAGSFDDMTYQEIAERFPDEFQARLDDKMSYRYPGIGGESYLDVINRLKPIINEMERTTNHMCLISHRVVCRILLAYFLNLKREDIGELDVPLHAVYVFEPQPFGVEWKLFEYNESTDSFTEVDPHNMANSKKMKEVGLSFRERKYSVVPTAPRQSVASSLRSLRDFRSSVRVVSDLSRARGIPRPQAAGSQASAGGQGSVVGGRSSNSSGPMAGYRNPFAKRSTGSTGGSS